MSDYILAFDFGLKRIGVAVGQRITRTATPKAILKASDGAPDWAEVKRLIDEWQPAEIIVGKPINMDGTEFDMTQKAPRFANRLNGRFRLPVTMVDERLSSIEARERDPSSEHIDDVAAGIILETYLNESS